MTEGLLTSCNSKNTLHKKMIYDRTDRNINMYKVYRNIYNKTLRAGKKLFYENCLKNASKNPQKKHGRFWTKSQATANHAAK